MAVPTILVVDDDNAVRQFVRDVLAIGGYTVSEAADGAAALRLATTAPPDLVLCDVNMPGLDGFAMLRAWRASPTHGQVPFIFLTGVSDRAAIRRGMELGADDYLTKPCAPADLLTAVRVRLDRQQKLAALHERDDGRLPSGMIHVLPHELYTPLQAILGFASILASDHRHLPPDEITEFSHAIHQSAQRLGLEMRFGAQDFDTGRVAWSQPFVTYVPSGDFQVQAQPPEMRVASPAPDVVTATPELVTRSRKTSPEPLVTLSEGGKSKFG